MDRCEHRRSQWEPRLHQSPADQDGKVIIFDFGMLAKGRRKGYKGINPED